MSAVHPSLAGKEAEDPFLWNETYLADKQVTLRIDRAGVLYAPGAQQRRLMGLVP